MHIAVLDCNTDRSRFAARHPRDGEKWRRFLHRIRPGWQVTAFAATAGELPENPSEFDGLILSGSLASARGEAPWILALLDLIRAAEAARIPLFGVCFGHQAIARALGGTVADNPGHFVLGIVEAETRPNAPWLPPAPTPFRIAAAHGEQVTALPAGAAINSAGPGCPIGGFTIGTHVFTSEYHPEMTQDFIAALTEALAKKLPAEVIAFARMSLKTPADSKLFGEWLAQFFER